MDYFISPDFIAGCVAGSVGIIATQPMDTIRIRMQVHLNPRRSIGQHFSQIISNEGVRGLFRGIASPTLSVGAMNAVLFHAFEGARTFLVNRRVSHPDSVYAKISSPYDAGKDCNYIDTIAAGFFGGVMSCFITCPTELIKIIVQDQTAEGTATIRQEWREAVALWRNHGTRRGLFRGLHTTILRDSWSYAFYFWVYDVICNNYHKISLFGKGDNKDSKTTMASFWGGFWAGMLCWASAYPFDVVKTHYQLQKLEYARLPLFQAVRHHVRGSGFGIFYNGLAATLIRAGPQHAILFTCYEFVKKQIVQMQQEGESSLKVEGMIA